MKVPRLRLTAVTTAIVLLLLTASNALAFSPGSSYTWTQTFDTNTNGWHVDKPGDTDQFGYITEVASGAGTLGVTSADGTGHAEVNADDSDNAADGERGPYTYFDGLRSAWPGEWTASIDIYLDPDALPADAGFDYSVAANGTDGAYQSEFIFHVAKYETPNRIVIAAPTGSNNFEPRDDLETLTPHATISSGQAGWYTFKHRFYDDGGVLKVDLTVQDDGGNVLFSDTQSRPADLIPGEVGGNRYGWFTFIDGGPFAIDNSTLTISGGYEVVHRHDLEPSNDTPSDVYNSGSDKWFFYNDETDILDNSLGSFVTGPADPAGEGSVQISVSGDQRRNLATYQFRGIQLKDIDVLSFSTYNPSAGNGGSADNSAYLQFNVDFNGSDDWQKRLTYLPKENGTVLQDTWQSWDAIDGGNALWSWSGGTPWPDGETAEYRTWQSIIDSPTFANARIRVSDSFLGFRVGEPYTDGYTENIDTFTFGANGNLTTFDFEPPNVQEVIITEGRLETSTDLSVVRVKDNWLFYDDTHDAINNALGSFVAGPAGTKGLGSAQATVSSITERTNLATYQFRGTPLADIKVMAFSTYNASASNAGSADRSGYLNFNVDFDGSDADDDWQYRLVYVPSKNGTVQPDTWQEWNTIDEGNALWSWSGYQDNSNQWPDGNTTQYRTWADILSTWPTIRIRATDAHLGLRVGEPYDSSYTENFDTFTFGVDNNVTIFNFEPRALYIDDATVSMHGQSTFEVPVVLDSGDEDLSAVSFTVHWDQPCVTFDSITDSDNNGVPDAVSGLPSSTDFDVTVTHDSGAREVTLLIKSLNSDPLSVLSDGILAKLTFNASACDTTPGSTPPVSVAFSFPTSTDPSVIPSFGNDEGQSVEGATDGGTVTLDFNDAPNDIVLSNDSVAENQPAGTPVGTLCTDDDTPQGTDCASGPATFIYSLVGSGVGCSDASGNFAFQISGNELQTAGSLDYEAAHPDPTTYSVCVQSTDTFGQSLIETFVIHVTNVNEVPTNIELPDSHVDENAPDNAVVGTLNTVDEDLEVAANNESHVYTFCGTAPAAFIIDGDELQKKPGANLDHETQGSYNICIRSTDSGGLFVERNFTITVDDVNDAPVAVDDYSTAAPLVVIGNGTPVDIDVLANDTDQDGDTLSINSVTNGAHGTTSIVTGSPDKARFTANADYNGPDSFTYTAKDDGSPNNLVSNDATVTLAIVADRARADCNADGQIDAADFPATVLELFDHDDGIGWWLAYTGEFAGNPLGCDSNNSKNGLSGTDQSVNAADIICTVLIFFGDDSCSEAVTVAANAAAGSVIIPDQISGAAGETVSIPVTLETGGNRIAAATFALNLDSATASFDPTDGNGDGIPDAVTLNVPAGVAKTVIFDADANRIQVAVYGTALPMPLLSDGVLATIEVQLQSNSSALSLSQASLGSDAGQSVAVDGVTTPTQQQPSGALFLPLLSHD